MTEEESRKLQAVVCQAQADQVGQQLVFDPEDIFDWMVLQEGHLHGGFTLRVAREKLPEAEREAYDRYIGISVYEPLPG